MSRYYIKLHNNGRIDPEAAIGYDRPLRTFFLQGFIPLDSELDEPEIWLGTFLEEFPTLESLVEEARTRGFEIAGLKQADMIVMLAAAGQKHEPSLGERLGLIF